jgi:D-glycero-D-manno-heptose 1,7-bisphosphate phosphatase
LHNKAILLDRDGTINVDYGYVYKKKDLYFIDESIEGLKLLQKAGYLLIILTNQSGIARGYYTEEDFWDFQNFFNNTLKTYGIKIDGVYFCPHHPKGIIKKYSIECECRKPKIGMFRRAINDFAIDTSISYAIGDNLRDLEICKSTLVKGILIDNSLNCSSNNIKTNYFVKKSNLLDAALYIVNKNRIIY